MIERVAPTLHQLRKGRVTNTDPCPCGSGKLYMRCHKFRPNMKIISMTFDEFKDYVAKRKEEFSE